jgi:hypothetical protein
MKRDTKSSLEKDEVRHNGWSAPFNVSQNGGCAWLAFHVQALCFIGAKPKTEVQGGGTQFTIKKHGFS